MQLSNAAERVGMGLVIAPSPLHSAQTTPLLTAEKALVGDPEHVILTGSMVERRNKSTEAEGD